MFWDLVRRRRQGYSVVDGLTIRLMASKDYDWATTASAMTDIETWQAGGLSRAQAAELHALGWRQPGVVHLLDAEPARRQQRLDLPRAGR